jgi:hypothetical protein
MRSPTLPVVPALVLALTAASLAGCPKAEEAITTPFTDDFERSELGSAYLNTGGPYEVKGGKLVIKEGYNHPLWLKRALPRDAVIELDVTSKSSAGDIKVEAWGDGQSFATTRGAYLATSYVFIFGGWGNSTSTLIRLDEHAPDRIERTDRKVEVGRTYHFKIQRKGKKIDWSIDGKPFLALEDGNPLEGDNHSYFGFNDWESELIFDNLKIAPLP